MKSSHPDIPAQYGLVVVSGEGQRVIQSRIVECRNGAQAILVQTRTSWYDLEHRQYIPPEEIVIDKLTRREAFAAGFVISVKRGQEAMVIPYNPIIRYDRGMHSYPEPRIVRRKQKKEKGLSAAHKLVQGMTPEQKRSLLREFR